MNLSRTRVDSARGMTEQRAPRSSPNRVRSRRKCSAGLKVGEKWVACLRTRKHVPSSALLSPETCLRVRKYGTRKVSATSTRTRLSFAAGSHLGGKHIDQNDPSGIVSP